MRAVKMCLSVAVMAALSPVAHAEDIQRAISMIQLGSVPEGVNTLKSVAKAQPNSQLALQMHNDLLQARFGVKPRLAVSSFTKKAAKTSYDSAKTEALIAESRVRLFHHFNPPPKNALPSSILQSNSSEPYIIAVDQSKSRVYVFQNKGNNQWTRVADYYSSIGRGGSGKEYEGDLRTPVGVYFITSKKADAELPELYGVSAFPVNYPNSWDISQKRTGSGIWLHGVPRTTYTRAPLASRGCVVLANEHMIDIEQYLRIGKTPVILADRLEWREPGTVKLERDAFLTKYNAWVSDWQSLKTDAYLAHYSDNFYAQNMNKRRWSAYKRRVNARKKFIKVKISEQSIYRMPKEPVIVTTFKQSYESDNHKSTSIKRQYWHFDGASWKIVFEDSLN